MDAKPTIGHTISVPVFGGGKGMGEQKIENGKLGL